MRVGRQRARQRGSAIDEPLLDVSPYVDLPAAPRAEGAGRATWRRTRCTVGYRRYQARRAHLRRVRRAGGRRRRVWAGVNLYQMFELPGRKENAARQTALLTSAVPGDHPPVPGGARLRGEPAEDGRDRAGAARDRRARRRGDGAREPGAGGESEHRHQGVRLEIRRCGDRGRAQRSVRPPAPAPARPLRFRDRRRLPAARKESALIDGEIRPFRGDLPRGDHHHQRLRRAARRGSAGGRGAGRQAAAQRQSRASRSPATRSTTPSRTRRRTSSWCWC